MRKKQILPLEIIIWIVLLSGLIFLGLNIIKYNIDNKPKYEIVFQDVDGLMVGSPVRIMGIHVGHVTSVKAVYDEVHLTFAIEDEGVTIPKGTLASVQFTGIAGSKSLELVPGKDVCLLKKRNLVAVEPIRINSLFEIQNQILESVVAYSQNVLDVMGDKSPKELSGTVKDVVQTTKELNTTIEDASSVLVESRNILVDSANGFSDVLSEQINWLKREHKNVVENTKQQLFNIKEINKFSLKVEKHIKSDFSQQAAAIKENEAKVKEEIKQVKLKKQLNLIDESIIKFQEFIAEAQKLFNKQNIINLKKDVKKIKEDSELLNK